MGETVGDGYLQVVGLKKVYERSVEAAVNNIGFEVEKGRIVTLLGPSGCGKTTTLRCIAGLEEPTDGDILIAGEHVNSVRKRIMLRPEKRDIGMVFQSYAVWPHLTVYHNIAFPLEVRKRPKAEIERRVGEVIELVGLAGFGERYVNRLSGGQQQRVALARALVSDPRILLFDEPLSNLDAKLRERMRIEIRRLQREVSITSVYVTHDQAEAMVISDTVIVMNNGVIEQIGDPRTIYSRPANQFVANFIGIANVLTGKVIGPSDRTAGVIARVDLSTGQQQLLDCVPSTTTASSGRVAVTTRPEDIVLHHEAPADARNVLAGRVESAVYLGDHVDYVVRVGDHNLRVNAHPSIIFEPGAIAYLEMKPEYCLCIPSASATAGEAQRQQPAETIT
jgi:iron(III) transport system ATP-binding protein